MNPKERMVGEREHSKTHYGLSRTLTDKERWDGKLPTGTASPQRITCFRVEKIKLTLSVSGHLGPLKNHTCHVAMSRIRFHDRSIWSSTLTSVVGHSSATSRLGLVRAVF